MCEFHIISVFSNFPCLLYLEQGISNCFIVKFTDELQKRINVLSVPIYFFQRKQYKKICVDFFQKIVIIRVLNISLYLMYMDQGISKKTYIQYIEVAMLIRP